MKPNEHESHDEHSKHPHHAHEHHEHHEKPVKYYYTLEGQKIESDTSSINGATIKAKLAPEKRVYSLFLESEGKDPDKLVNDADCFPLEIRHHRFYCVPPATFGLK